MIIYALVDPRNNLIRYIGKSHRTAHRRLRRHLAACYLTGNTHKERWIRQLLRVGLEPEITILQHCSTPEELNRAERDTIRRLRDEGVALTNATDGGDGGGKHTPESKERIRRALTGRSKSPEHRANLTIAQRGRKASAETRAKLSEERRARGYYPPPRYGADNNKTKLTSAQVAEIRALKGTLSQRALARQFGVSKSAIRFIHIGRNWREKEAV